MADQDKKNEEIKEPEAESAAEKTDEKKSEKKVKKEIAALEKELKEVKESLAKAKDDLSAEKDRYARMFAEYENFRRRSQSEKEGVYSDAVVDVISAILPVIDSLEMAAAYKDGDSGVAKGVEMTLSNFRSALEKLGVGEIECDKFDPNKHNAVMHIEDDTLGEGVIVETLRKGYQKGDKVIRYAMVKVAN